MKKLIKLIEYNPIDKSSSSMINANQCVESSILKDRLVDFSMYIER